MLPAWCNASLRVSLPAQPRENLREVFVFSARSKNAYNFIFSRRISAREGISHEIFRKLYSAAAERTIGTRQAP
jgi:hypothetical protein